MSDEVALLWAFSASEAQTLATALDQLCDMGILGRYHAIEAQHHADVWSWHWALRVRGEREEEIMDPPDRMAAVREYLTAHLDELEALRERLQLYVP